MKVNILGFYQNHITAFFMSVDHSRDALMQRPYKVLVMAI